MTLRPNEQQKTLHNIQKQHKDLLLQRASPEEIDLEQVQVFLHTLAQAGTIMDDSEDRSLLNELIRYWSSFVDYQTGGFPVIQLQPFDSSLRVSGPLVLQDHLASSSSQPLIWNIPFARNPFFTGREDLLAQLHSQLQTAQSAVVSQPQAISGLGGVVRHEAT